MKKIIVLLLPLIFLLSGGNTYHEGIVNPHTGVIEFLSGEVYISEVFAAFGIIVGADCTLTVEGDVEAGSFFICRGGIVCIKGTLRADCVYFDSAEGELYAQLGSEITGFYTQCGGEVVVSGSIAARAGARYDGRGLICISSEFDLSNATRLELEGGVFSRGGDLVIGAAQNLDEASAAAFYSLRGLRVFGYANSVGTGCDPFIAARRGLHASEGGSMLNIKY